MATLTCRRNRVLHVKESVDEIKALIEAGTPFIEVTQVKVEAMYKTPTPIDTKYHNHLTEIKHQIAVATIEDYHDDYKAPVFTHRDLECECTEGKTNMYIPDTAEKAAEGETEDTP